MYLLKSVSVLSSFRSLKKAAINTMCGFLRAGNFSVPLATIPWSVIAELRGKGVSSSGGNHERVFQSACSPLNSHQ